MINTKHHQRLALMLLSSCASLAVLSTTAFAQDRSTNVDEMDEIIVVGARGRQESLQNVPISETVFNAADIESANITNTEDVLNLTPGVTFAKTQGPGSGFLTVRGLTQVRNSEPPVATVVDGILQIEPQQFLQEMFDIESIEVLRGPQGALYGRNASGGAIIINTKKPTNELQGYVAAGIASGNEYSIGGSVSGPIIEDKLLYRVSGKYLTREGYFDNFITGLKTDPYEDITMRGLLTANLAANLTADLKANIVRSSGAAINFRWQAFNYDPVTGLASVNGFSGPHIDANRVDRQFSLNNESNADRNIDEFSLRLNLDTDFGTVTSATSYNKVFRSVVGDAAPYDAAQAGGQGGVIDVSAFSQDLKIASHDNQDLRWMIGAYYLATDRFQSTISSDDRGFGLIEVLGRAPITNPNNPTTSFIASDNENTAWAAYANLTYDFTDWLEAYAGVRYDDDNRKRITLPNVTAGLPAGCTVANEASCVDEGSFSAWQPKFSLRAKISEDISVYGSWGRGFRSGQFNQSGTAAIAALATPPLIGVADLAGDEVTDTFELGLKSKWLDDRVRLNVALFDSTVKGQHYFSFVAAISAQIISNLDEVSLRGFEIEADAELFEGFDINVGYSYIDTEITAFALSPGDVGNKAPYVADSTLNIGAKYETGLTENLDLFMRGDYERRGEQFWQTSNVSPRNPLNLVNLRLGVKDSEGAWNLIASVENATDVVYNSEFCCGGFVYPAPPRMYKIDLRVNF